MSHYPKPTLKVDFSDFGGIDKANNWFTRILSDVFHVVISDKPDLLIFQEGGHLNRLYTCKKLFWTGESIQPDWSRTDYAMTCHYIDSPRHLRFPYYVWGAEASPSDLIKTPNEAVKVAGETRKFCSTVISNANPRRAQERIKFFHLLNKKKMIDSGGRFQNNVGLLPPGGRPKHNFIKNYKFNLCYENKNVPGYTTEKLVQAMLARCVPIYWGNPIVENDFNSKSFLYRDNFADDDSFIENILEVDRDLDLYLEYLRQPFFHTNSPNEYYDENRVLQFLLRVIDSDTKPVSQIKRKFTIGRWTFAKRQHF